jgi:signal transduction histidine kinase
MEAVGQLTGGIAHDFNNLLTVVLGSLDLLGLELAPESESRAYLEEARHAVAHGALLTQHLLAFARRQSLSPKPTDINALIAGFAPILQRTLGEDVRLTTDLEPALWPATVDGAQLENVLLNLALNARDALPAGGGIAIATGNVVIGDDDAAALEEVTPGPYVVLSLSDDGEGMSAEVQARAVEPFYTTKEVGAGSGLGLSMVFGLVKQSRGHMLIDSAPGAGTTVSLYLPQAGETEPAEAAVAAPADALF